MSRVCSLEGCDRRHYGHGWCQLHWKRWRAHGDPNVCVRSRLRWPTGPFLAVTTSEERMRCGLSGSTLNKPLLTDREADNAATRLGLHPSHIWPGWFDPYWPADLDLADPGWLEVGDRFDRSSERRRVAAEDWSAWLWTDERLAA